MYSLSFALRKSGSSLFSVGYVNRTDEDLLTEIQLSNMQYLLQSDEENSGFSDICINLNGNRNLSFVFMHEIRGVGSYGYVVIDNVTLSSGPCRGILLFLNVVLSKMVCFLRIYIFSSLTMFHLNTLCHSHQMPILIIMVDFVLFLDGLNASRNCGFGIFENCGMAVHPECVDENLKQFHFERVPGGVYNLNISGIKINSSLAF